MTKIDSSSLSFSNDLFEMLKQQGELKIRMGTEDPVKYKFLFEVFYRDSDLIFGETDADTARIFSSSKEKIFEFIDKGRFKEGVDVKKAVDIVFFCIRGIYGQYTDEYKKMSAEETLLHIDKVKEEIYGYFDILRRIFYKEEYW